jgi:hypothetical protein
MQSVHPQFLPNRPGHQVNPIMGAICPRDLPVNFAPNVVVV